MRIGVVFPQTEIGADPGAIREYAQAVEGMGYDHLLLYDHVAGADPEGHPGWSGPYTHRSMFHEPFVVLAYIAAFTRRVELVTGVLILPQRQTVLVAKQAAELDLLSSGRLRLGIGIGWNAVEFEALGENFHNRGKRSEEQVAVLRALWTQETVSFSGRWHRITSAGINPLPVQRPIPIWFGGGAEAVIQRIARLGDGWFPQLRPDDRARVVLERFHGLVREAGRDPKAIGIEGRVNLGRGTPDDWTKAAADWRALGATHLSVNTMGAGLQSPQDHIHAMRRFKEGVRV